MDFGMFKLGKTGFALWMITPLAVMAAVVIPATLHCRQINLECDRRLAILSELPEMSRINTRAGDTLKGFALQPSAASDIAAGASLRVQKAAQKHNFVIRSLTAEKAVKLGASGVQAVTISAQGEGSLPAVIEMFDDLHRPEELCNAESFQLKLLQSVTDRMMYSGQMALKCHAVVTTAGK